MISRQQRRALERRGDRALARARGSIISTNPARDIALVREDGSVRIVSGELAPYVLASLGLEDFYLEIERLRGGYAYGWIPTVIIVDGMASCTWTETHHLSRGGAA